VALAHAACGHGHFLFGFANALEQVFGQSRCPINNELIVDCWFVFKQGKPFEFGKLLGFEVSSFNLLCNRVVHNGRLLFVERLHEATRGLDRHHSCVLD
jgi:hypothetical protein